MVERAQRSSKQKLAQTGCYRGNLPGTSTQVFPLPVLTHHPFKWSKCVVWLPKASRASLHGLSWGLASRQISSPEQCTYSNSSNTSSQIQQASKHHDKEIQQDEGGWSEVTQSGRKGLNILKRTEGYLTCLEMVSAHWRLSFNMDTVKNNISEVVCDGRLWRWRFRVPPIHFPRRHSCLSFLAPALKALFFGLKPCKQSCAPLSLPNFALPSLLTATNTPLFHWRWRLCSWK